LPQSIQPLAADDLDLLNALASTVRWRLTMPRPQSTAQGALARVAYGRFMPEHVVNEILKTPALQSRRHQSSGDHSVFRHSRFTSMARPCRLKRSYNFSIILFRDDADHLQTPWIVGQVHGDGLMALFGVPQPQSDAAIMRLPPPSKCRAGCDLEQR